MPPAMSPRHIFDCFQAQGFDARFAQFGSHRAPQIPFAGDDERRPASWMQDIASCVRPN